MKKIKITLLAAAIASVMPAKAQWSTSGTNVYYNSGNVGIGTASPAQKLDVNGSLQLSNNIFSGGYAQFSNAGFGIPNVRIGHDGTNSEAISVYGSSIGTPVLNVRNVAYALGTGKGVIDIEADHNYMYGPDGSGAALKYKVSAFNTSMNPHWGVYMDMQDNAAGSMAPVTTYYTKVQTVNNNAYGFYADAGIKAGGTGKAYAFYGNAGMNYFAGNTGIGTATPDAKLHVAGSFKLADGSQGAGKVLTSDANGMATWQTATGGGNTVWTDAGSGNIYTTNLIGSVGIGLASVPANFKVAVDGNITTTGKIAIGTTDMAKISNYALAVNGDAIFNKARVKLYGNWPDFVFEEKYGLLPIAELDQFIKNNKHLPNVPSAAQVQKEGIDLGANQAILLQKIEELTLYIIQQQKQIDELKIQLKRN